jgi:hypothetical protein
MGEEAEATLQLLAWKPEETVPCFPSGLALIQGKEWAPSCFAFGKEPKERNAFWFVPGHNGSQRTNGDCLVSVMCDKKGIEEHGCKPRAAGEEENLCLCFFPWVGGVGVCPIWPMRKDN